MKRMKDSWAKLVPALRIMPTTQQSADLFEAIARKIVRPVPLEWFPSVLVIRSRNLGLLRKEK